MPTSLEYFLGVLAGCENREDRRSIAHLSASARRILADGFVATTRLVPTDHANLNAETSFFFAVRTFWNLVPEALFEQASPNFERMASRSVSEILRRPDPKLEKDLSVIYRRLREARRKGRVATSLDLERSAHKEMFFQQSRRCAVCGYKFSDDDFVYKLDDHDKVYVAGHERQDGEVALEKYNRRPVLDHIIPLYLGGDRPENWQILCQSCNMGKSDALSWMWRRIWVPTSRIGDLFNLTTSLRYAVLANYLAETEMSTPSTELRIYRKDPEKLIYFDNLKVHGNPGTSVERSPVLL